MAQLTAQRGRAAWTAEAMGLSQALSSALAGVNTTQQSLSVIAGNVANANTPGYVEETASQVAVAISGQPGAGVDVAGINRDLNTLLQGQLWTETSGSSYADTSSQIYQQLQQIYGTPGTSTSFDAIYNNFTTAVQGLSSNPASASQQSAVIGAAQALAQNLNSMTSTIQQLRTQAEQGISTGVQIGQHRLAADRADQPAARGRRATTVRPGLARRPARPGHHPARTADECHRRPQPRQPDFDFYRQRPTTGRRPAGLAADLQQFGNAVADLVMERQSQPGRRWHHHADLAERHHHRSASPKALSNRDSSAPTSRCATTSCRRRKISSTNLPTRCRRRCRTRPRAARRSPRAVRRDSTSMSGRCCPAIRCSSAIPIPVTSRTTSPSCRSARAGRCRCRSSPPNSNNQIIGINFSGGLSSVVSQLNTAFGTNLQFCQSFGHGAAGAQRQRQQQRRQFAVGDSDGDLAEGRQRALPLFTAGGQPITGALTPTGSQTTGLAGTIAVNPALTISPSSLVAYAANHVIQATRRGRISCLIS